MAVRVGEHHLGDQFARRRFPVGGGQHRTGIDPEAQFQQVVDHGPERRHDFGGNLLLQPREIRRTPVDAVAQQMQVRPPVVAVDLDAGDEPDAPFPGQPGSLADAPHRVVVGQRKGVQPAGGAQTDDCGDGKLSPSLLYPEWMWRSYAAIISRGKTRSRRSAPQPRGRSADATPCGGSGSPCGRRTTRRAYRARRPARSAPREASKRG